MTWRRYALLLPLVITVSCVSAEQAARQFIERGDRDAAAGRDEAAAIDFKNAVKNDPNSAEAYRKLGDANLVKARAVLQSTCPGLSSASAPMGDQTSRFPNLSCEWRRQNYFRRWG